MLVTTLVIAFAAANPGTTALPPLPRQELILVDDRPVKAQVAPALLQTAAADIGKRTGVTTMLLSAVPKLDAKAFAACASNKCLADLGRKHGADVVVTLRVEKREGLFVLSATRVPVLAKVKRAEDTVLARNEAELGTALADALAKLFPSAGPSPPTSAPTTTTTTAAPGPTTGPPAPTSTVTAPTTRPAGSTTTPR